MNIAAAIPVNGRHPLLKYTIERLLKKCGVSNVVCVGERSDRHVCEQNGALFHRHANSPLGRKWNYAFQLCKELNPDAVLFVGSSDWVSDDWCRILYPYLENNLMVGKLGCHLLDISKIYRVLYWPGYAKGLRRKDFRRKNEPIGIGRMLSRDFLNSINWKPFEDHQENSLDWSMYLKARGKVAVSDDNVYSLSVSTNRWGNKHKFEDHWRGILPSQRVDINFCDDYFPEYKLV